MVAIFSNEHAEHVHNRLRRGKRAAKSMGALHLGQDLFFLGITSSTDGVVGCSGPLITHPMPCFRHNDPLMTQFFASADLENSHNRLISLVQMLICFPSTSRIRQSRQRHPLSDPIALIHRLSLTAYPRRKHLPQFSQDSYSQVSRSLTSRRTYPIPRMILRIPCDVFGIRRSSFLYIYHPTPCLASQTASLYSST